MEPSCYVCDARRLDANDPELRHVWIDGIGDVHMCKEHFDGNAMIPMPWWDTKRTAGKK